MNPYDGSDWDWSDDEDEDEDECEDILFGG
jgi:hypothetical protein